jgi:hypothetical protein
VSLRPQAYTSFVGSLGVVFSPAQRAFYGVAFDGVEPEALDAAMLAMARLLFGDVDTVPSLARSVVVMAKGARVGGTRFAALRLLHLALTLALLSLAPGEHAFAIIVAPDLRLARQALRYIVGAVRAVPSLARLIVGEAGKDSFTIRRPDGRHVTFECLPCTRGGSAVRGRSLVGAVMSEAAFFRDADSVVNDLELYKAILPRLIPGAQLIIESTTWLSQGLLYDLHRDNFGAPESALVGHCPTRLLRADDARTMAIIASEEKRDPDAAALEFGDRLFISGGATIFLEPVWIERAVNVQRPDVVFAPNHARGAGADVGLIKDSSAIGVVSCHANQFELLALEELRPKKGEPLKLSAVIAAFALVLRAHGLAEFLADGHVREPAREFADHEKIQIVGAPEGRAGKEQTYLLLQGLFREGRISLPDHPRLLAQLRAVVARPAPGGGFVFTSPRRASGGHGDLVSALVLAVFAASIAQADNARQPPPGTGPSYTFENAPLGHFGINEMNPFNF